MQLKLQRSQREGGVMSKSVIFCLDARVEFTPAEQQSITKYKLHKQVIYNSEASKRALDGGAARVDGSTVGHLKSLAFTALAAMNLNISIESLQRGQHVECKSMDELLGAEEAIMDACRNLRGYLDTAATFDGREVLISFNTDEPEVLASAPAPMLVAPTKAVAAQSTPAPKLAGPVVAPDTIAEPVMYQTNLDGTRTPLVDNGWGALERLIPWLKSEWERDPRKVLVWGGVAFVVLWILISIIF